MQQIARQAARLRHVLAQPFRLMLRNLLLSCRSRHPLCRRSWACGLRASRRASWGLLPPCKLQYQVILAFRHSLLRAGSESRLCQLSESLVINITPPNEEEALDLLWGYLRDCVEWLPGYCAGCFRVRGQDTPMLMCEGCRVARCLYVCCNRPRVLACQYITPRVPRVRRLPCGQLCMRCHGTAVR